MSDTTVSVIGLGKMGSALAQCFIDKGVSTTVWNRSASKAERFADTATIASSSAEACAASDIVVTCVSNYANADTILHASDTTKALKGKLLVQLTSGSPNDARICDAWAKENGIDYLDAAILGYPSGVGGPGAVVFYSGDKAHWNTHQQTLSLLAGSSRYVGEAIGAAAAVDCAILETLYAATAGALHGAALCEAEGYPTEDYFDALRELFPLVSGTIEVSADMVNRRDYAGDQCALSVHLAAIKNIQRASRDANLASEVPDSLVRAYARPVEDGHGDDELAVIFEGQRAEK